MMLPRMHVSPMPMNTMSGFDSATATAPTEELRIWPSVTAAGGAEIRFARAAFDAGDRDGTSAARRAEAAPLVGLQDDGVDGWRAGRLRHADGAEIEARRDEQREHGGRG